MTSFEKPAVLFTCLTYVAQKGTRVDEGECLIYSIFKLQGPRDQQTPNLLFPLSFDRPSAGGSTGKTSQDVAQRSLRYESPCVLQSRHERELKPSERRANGPAEIFHSDMV